MRRSMKARRDIDIEREIYAFVNKTAPVKSGLVYDQVHSSGLTKDQMRIRRCIKNLLSDRMIKQNWKGPNSCFYETNGLKPIPSEWVDYCENYNPDKYKNPIEEKTPQSRLEEF